MYGRRIPKTHPRAEAYGTVDELNAALGQARCQAGDWAAGQLLLIQKDLVALMGELAVAEQDHARYAESKFPKLEEAALTRLDEGIARIESLGISFDGWATPGHSPLSAALDMSRTVCRRAERRVIALRETGETVRPLIIATLNRLSDFLWLLARYAEAGCPPL
jgi:cob(I)alamin adenosyltransferase